MASNQFSRDFGGFDGKEKGESARKALQLRLEILEQKVGGSMLERVDILEREFSDYRKMYKHCKVCSHKADPIESELKEKIRSLESRMETMDGEIRKLNGELEVLRSKTQGDGLGVQMDFRQRLEEEVCRLLKQKNGRIETLRNRDRYVVIYGDREYVQKDWKQRISEQRKKIESIFNTIEEGNRNWEDEIEEIRRLGRFRDGKARPIRVKFVNEMTPKGLLTRAGKLRDSNNYGDIKIKKLLDEDERAELKKLLEEARVRNGDRSEEDKNEFFWRVVDLNLRKWYIRKSGQGSK